MKLIDGLDYHYINKKGQIISTYKNKYKVLKSSTSDEYSKIKLKGKTYRVHRLVAQAFINNPENKPQVNHIDGDKFNNKVENLEWCTNSENQLHAFRAGLNYKKTPVNAALDEEMIEEIIRLYVEERKSTLELSKEFNVSATTIGDMLSGKYYNIDKKRVSVTRAPSKRKLTFNQAEEIRNIFDSCEISLTALGREYGVNHKTIQKIIKGISYKEETCND